MQKLVLYSTLSLILFAACSKDKFQDKPTIEIKSINPTQVPATSGSYSEILLDFTDKQGDLDSVLMFKIWYNSHGLTANRASFTMPLPEFPEKTKGQIKLTLDAAGSLAAADHPASQPDAPNGKEPDTIAFKIVVKDKAGHTSDTATTGQLVIERS